MTIDKFNKKYKSKSVSKLQDYDDKLGLPNGLFSNTPSYGKNENEYLIYFIESYCDNSDYCNHGEFLFAAFNDKTNEVIHKWEAW